MKARTAFAAVAALLAIGSPAHAAVVAQLGTTAGYLALPGEANRVVVTQDGADAVFDDTGSGPFIVGPGCTEVGPRSARCAGPRTLHFDLGDRNDRLVARSALHVRANGGDGDDVLVSG